MNQLTESITEEFKPKLAITVYTTQHENDFYLESHDINENGQVMEGKPLLQSTLQGIVDVFFDDRKNLSKITGIIPENMLAFDLLPGGQYRMIWWRPAEKRVLQHATALKIPTGRAWVPAMLYVVNRNGLDVFALATDKRPELNTKLFLAPYFNVNDDGDVCLGNARVKKHKNPTYDNMIKYWEDLFWLSEFSHVNGEEKVKSGDLAEFWRKLMKSKCRKKWSDIDQLMPSTYTLKKLLNA